MSGLSEEQMDQIRAEVDARPESLHELIDVVMELQRRLELAEEDAQAATNGLSLLQDKLRKAGVVS